MKLSIMMAAWNAEAYIRYALQSILSQAGGLDIKIIVVNDGSTDGTAAILSEMAAKHSQIRVITTENQGVTRARNAALEALSPDSDLVSFLDADDLVPQGRYQRDIQLFMNDPSLDVTYGNTLWFREVSDDQMMPRAGSETFSGRGVQLASGIYRYSLIKDVGLFDVSFKQAEDMDFMLRLFERSPNYQIIDAPCVYYRRHSSNMTHDITQVKRDFSRALLMSMKRRKGKNIAPYPSGLFEIQGLMEAYQW